MKKTEKEAYRKGWQECEEAMLEACDDRYRNMLDDMFFEARKSCKITL